MNTLSLSSHPVFTSAGWANSITDSKLSVCVLTRVPQIITAVRRLVILHGDPDIPPDLSLLVQFFPQKFLPPYVSLDISLIRTTPPLPPNICTRTDIFTSQLRVPDSWAPRLLCAMYRNYACARNNCTLLLTWAPAGMGKGALAPLPHPGNVMKC